MASVDKLAHFVAIVAMIVCVSSMVKADCYVGSVRSNTQGNLPVSAVEALKIQNCGPSPGPTTPTQEPVTTTPTASPTAGSTNATTEPVTEPLTTAILTNGTTLATEPTTAPTTVATTTAAPTSNKATTTATPPPTTKQPVDAAVVPTTTPHVPTMPNVTTLPPPTAHVPTTSCAWFKYFDDDTKLKPSSVWVANFSCVEDCQPGATTINGTNGTLYCCDSTNCNSLVNFMQIEEVEFQTVSHCAKGDVNDDDIELKFNQTCTSDESYFCVNKTYSANGNITYRCSERPFNDFCINHGFINASGGCAIDETDNTTKCCCTLDDCNYSKGPPPEPSPEPTPASHHGLTKGTIAGLVFMGFFIGFMAGCCLTCYCFKRKRGGGESVDFNYTRIAANTTEDGAEY